MTNEPYKPQPLPASIQTQLAMYDSTIKDAEEKLAVAKADRRAMLDEFYGLMGKVVTTKYHNGSSTRFVVDRIHCMVDGSLFYVVGPRLKKDGSTSSHVRGYAYAREIAAGKVEIGDA